MEKIIFSLLFISSHAIKQYIVGGVVHDTISKDKDCEIIQYKANFKPLSIEFQSDAPLYYYLLTDVPYATCPSDCDSNSLYCTRGASQKAFKDIISACTESVYLYMVPKTPSRQLENPINITLKTDYVQDSPCEGYDRTPANYCKMLSIDQCLNECNQGCGLLHCFYKQNTKMTEAFSMCLPDTTSTAEQTRRCAVYEKANQHSWEGCGVDESNSAALFWLIFMVILGTLGLSLGAAVFYYRYNMKKNGRAPFTVPRWCPNCFFPRPRYDEGQSLRIIQ